MSILLSRRALLQSFLASAASAATAGPHPNASGAPFLFEAGRILVETDFTTPDGGSRKALAFFNMGMGRTVLASSLYEELGLESGARLHYALAGAAFETGAESVDRAKVDFSGLSLDQMFSPLKVEAILSPSLLLDRTLVLDYAKRRLIFRAPDRIAPEGAAAPISLNAATGLASVDVEVEGRSHAFVIDAGGAYCWIRGRTLAQWLAATPEWRRAEGAVGRANYNMIDFAFEQQGTVARLPRIAIGGTALQNIGVLGTGPLLGAMGDALVGEAFWDHWQKSAAGPVVGWLGLQHFRLTIDYPARQSYWRPHSAPDPHDLDQPGVSLVRRDGRYFIGGVVRPTRGVPLDGVSIGDELLAIDNLATRDAGKGAVLAALRGRPGETRRLALLGPGGERQVEAPVLDLS